MTRISAPIIALVAALAGGSVSAWQDLTRAEAVSMDRKVAAIVERSVKPKPGAPRVQTSFSEREVNAYLQFLGKDQLPVGLVSPRLIIGDAGKVEGRALVDLDAVRTSKPRGAFDPANLLTGSVEVWISGKLLAANNQGVFQLESATLAGVPISKSLLQQVVSFYSRTPENPNGFDLDRPFDLPAGIHAVQTRRGGATVIQ
jgi:hypothetical protein